MSALSTYVLENFIKATTIPKDDAGRINRGFWSQMAMKHGDAFAVEDKVDGVLAFAIKGETKTVLVTKHNGRYTAADYPELFRELDSILTFRRWVELYTEFVPKAKSKSGHEELYLHDILSSGGINFRSCNYADRKSKLQSFILNCNLDRVKVLGYEFARSYEDAQRLFDGAVARGMEGIMVKTLGKYDESSWYKLKKEDTIDCVITGEKATNSTARTGCIVSWHIGVFDDHGLSVDLGDASSCIDGVGKLAVGDVVEVRYQEISKNLKLRHPTIMRKRNDKTAFECLKSQIAGNEV